MNKKYFPNEEQLVRLKQYLTLLRVFEYITFARQSSILFFNISQKIIACQIAAISRNKRILRDT